MEMVRLAAVIVQLIVIVAASARYGWEAGLLVLFAIIMNSVQAAAIMKNDAAEKQDKGE